MSNLAKRVVTAGLGLPLVGALVLWEVRWGFGALVLVVVGLALAEYAAITLPGRTAVERAPVVAAGVLLALGIYMRPEAAAVWITATVVLMGIAALARPGDISGAAARLGIAGFGVFYIGGLAITLALLQRDVPAGPYWVFVAIGVTFANDTGAYFAGRALGRRKLYPSISPGKTVEGAVGGLVGALLFMFVARATFMSGLRFADCWLVALPASIVGPAGDLMESLIKRSAGVKDSGALLPGHGGMLDRIDALLFVAPYVYVYAAFLR
jgi:phosphatidate cytidylyltransferase